MLIYLKYVVCHPEDLPFSYNIYSPISFLRIVVLKYLLVTIAVNSKFRWKAHEFTLFAGLATCVSSLLLSPKYLQRSVKELLSVFTLYSSFLFDSFFSSSYTLFSTSPHPSSPPPPYSTCRLCNLYYFLQYITLPFQHLIPLQPNILIPLQYHLILLKYHYKHSSASLPSPY